MLRGVDFDVAAGSIFALLGSNGAGKTGGAINTESDESYINYMLPGIVLIAIASGIAYTPYRLFLDMLLTWTAVPVAALNLAAVRRRASPARGAGTDHDLMTYWHQLRETTQTRPRPTLSLA